MTGWDTFFVVMAALDLVFVGLMVAIALRMLQTMKQGQRRAEPAIRGARAVVEIGRAMAAHVTHEGQAVTARVKGVVKRVQRRVATTRRIVGELRPGGTNAAGAVRATGAQVAEHARNLGDMAQRLKRVRAAAEAAANAARKP